ncbi:hypothetical protein ASZ90_004091 [hydrocarbon metagenome]|uniref:Uncharacterized protein n=1 Tax=hydrocarbon metagenome TaxID=938273 RepID=A0A0W8FZ79_9ZZZZ
MLVINKMGINDSSVVAIKDDPTTITTSLGEGGNIFSTNAKKNNIK